MSLLFETPSSTVFAPHSSISSPPTAMASRKRKCGEVITDEFDLMFDQAPKKLLRREVSTEDVQQRDVCWTIQLDAYAQESLEVSFIFLFVN